MAAAPPVDDPTIKKITLLTTNTMPTPPSEEGAKPNNKTRRRNSKKNLPGVSANTRVVVTKDLGSTTTAAPAPAPAPAPAVTPLTQAAGAATSPGTFVQLASTHVPGSNSSKAVGATSGLTAAGAPVNGGAAPTTGGASKVRVVLAKSHKKKVLLAAPKPAVAAVAAKRKTAKKIHVSLKGLGSGLRRAKTIRKKASKHTLADIKKGLIEAKLIKADSKAPEDILRQMYADYMVLKSKAL
jgi:hypothetical protein